MTATIDAPRSPYAQTKRGVNLETADFHTLQQAFDFLQAVFSNGGAA